MSLETTQHVLEKIQNENLSKLYVGPKLTSRSPEELVGLGFRFWMAGYQNNNIEFWKKTWDYFSHSMGAETARSTIAKLAFWAQTVQTSSTRTIEVSNFEHEQFSRDERIAITMIAASQHNACPALQACASTLIGTGETEPVVKSTNDFASQLLNHDLKLTNTN